MTSRERSATTTMPMPTTTTTAPPIDYGRASPLRRRLLRRIVIALIVLTIVMIVWRTAPPVLAQLELRRQQSKMLNFTPPPDTVALTSDSAECDRLLAAGTHVLVDVQYMGTGTSYPMKMAGLAPALADSLFRPDLWGIQEPPRGARVRVGRGPRRRIALHARL
jgi:hypothetical protein